MSRSTAAAWALAVSVLAACREPAEIHELRGPTMGSRYIVKFTGGPDTAAVSAAIQQVLQEYDRTFSLWREDSEIASVNRYRGSEPLPLSANFRRVLELALAVARRSEGAFDPTVRPLTALYQRQRRGGERASAAELAGALQRVGWQRLRLTEVGLVKQRPDLELDLDGVVAGACAEAMAQRLRELGVDAAMLDITGEVLCFGSKPGGAPWEIGIAGQVDALALHDQALCTSGCETAIAAGGLEQHHIFDPRTGDNTARKVVSVTVLARSCALADALDTALMVLGPDAAAKLLEGWPGEPELGALFVLRQTDGSPTTRKVRWPQP